MVFPLKFFTFLGCVYVGCHMLIFIFFVFKFLTFFGCMNVGHGFMFKNLPSSLL